MSKYVWTTGDVLETADYPDTLDQGHVYGLTNTNISIVYGLVQDKQVVVSLRARMELPRWSSSEGNSGLRIGTKV